MHPAPRWDAGAPEFRRFMPGLKAAAPAMQKEVERLLKDRRLVDPSRALSYAGGMTAGDGGVRRTEGRRGGGGPGGGGPGGRLEGGGEGKYPYAVGFNTRVSKGGDDDDDDDDGSRINNADENKKKSGQGGIVHSLTRAFNRLP